MNEDKMRKQFEAWITTVSVASSIDRDESGLYKSSLAGTAWISWQAALSQSEPVQSEPVQVSQPVAEAYLVNRGGSGECMAIDWFNKKPVEGLLFTSPPDYEALRQRVAELEAAPPHQSEQVNNMVWMPVSERLPEKRARCLCLTEDGDIEVRKFCLHKFAGAHTRLVTHWMALPSAPKGEE